MGRIVAFPDDRRLVPPLRQMPVDAVPGDVEHPVLEPADAEVVAVEAYVLDAGGDVGPVQPLSLFGLEGVWRLARGLARHLVGVAVHVSARGPFLRDRIHLWVAHAFPTPAVAS